jgi:hypothetical protein
VKLTSRLYLLPFRYSGIEKFPLLLESNPDPPGCITSTTFTELPCFRSYLLFYYVFWEVFRIPAGAKDFLFSKTSRAALEPTSPLINGHEGRRRSPVVKRPAREADHLTPFSDELKNQYQWRCSSIDSADLQLHFP